MLVGNFSSIFTCYVIISLIAAIFVCEQLLVIIETFLSLSIFILIRDQTGGAFLPCLKEENAGQANIRLSVIPFKKLKETAKVSW